MKVSRYFLLYLSIFIFNFVFCMEESSIRSKTQIGLVDLPKDVWGEILKFGINKEGKTEKEVFADLDALMLTSAKIKKIVKEYVQKVGKLKNIENYGYGRFKADIMYNILKEKLGSKATDENILKEALNLKSYNFLNYSPEYKSKYAAFKELSCKNLMELLENAGRNKKEIEKLLSLGISPNCKVVGPESTPFERLMFSISFDVGQKYGVLTSTTDSYKFSDIIRLSGEELIELIKMVLSHGGNPVQGSFSPYKRLEFTLENFGKLRSLPNALKPKALKILEEIKRLFDEAIKNQNLYNV